MRFKLLALVPVVVTIVLVPMILMGTFGLLFEPAVNVSDGSSSAVYDHNFVQFLSGNATQLKVNASAVITENNGANSYLNSSLSFDAWYDQNGIINFYLFPQFQGTFSPNLHPSYATAEVSAHYNGTPDYNVWVYDNGGEFISNTMNITKVGINPQAQSYYSLSETYYTGNQSSQKNALYNFGVGNSFFGATVKPSQFVNNLTIVYQITVHGLLKPVTCTMSIQLLDPQVGVA